MQEIRELSEQALAVSRAAEEAASVEEVKAQADRVFEVIWGISSGLAQGQSRGAANVHGWKVQWQVDGSEFDSAFAARYGTRPPAITDPRMLGIMGRGRYVRRQLQALIDDAGTSEDVRQAAVRTVTALNNVIGWMRMDDGVTKGERQPRVDLTYQWDAPSEFWLSTADTGWLHEVYAQALNILKTDYEGDVAAAREHAAGMTQLIEKSLNGIDVDQDGAVEPDMMEGGLYTAIGQAEAAGLMGS